MRRMLFPILAALLFCPALPAMAASPSGEATAHPEKHAGLSIHLQKSGLEAGAALLAEWPGAPCINDADCGELKCCDKICADSCRDAAPLSGGSAASLRSRACLR
ncbi:hypothetical protein [Paucidesulfovibrio longus]|uniref:hypothetical protein n=1 Tax=Paucidesulfovibrio longus TaxID=889 RepID=UPI0003B34258|nr:hypothetical protein [Paucidesulfovibrio longus]